MSRRRRVFVKTKRWSFILFFIVIVTSVFPRQVVLLVPAIMGSTLRESGSVVPRLPPPPDSLESLPSGNLLKIHDPYGIVGFSRLKTRIESDTGKYVFEAPYDWRQTLETIWKMYLKPRIDEAKVFDEEEKVDIIAHSMGGLVVRAYIQSDAYENDIRRFIMLGTPNEGYPEVYLLLEGNGFHENKRTKGIFEVENLPIAMLQQVQVKESIIFEQLLKRIGYIEKDSELFASQTVVILREDGYAFERNGKTLFLTYAEISEAVKQVFPSLFSLLPTFPFLKTESGYVSYQVTQPNELTELNREGLMGIWKQRVGFLSGQIRAFLFLSRSGDNNTTRAILLPGMRLEKSSGDGTVLDDFVGPESFKQVFEETVTVIRNSYGRHDGLPGNEEIQKEILRILNNP
jgi:hypothetical protein